MQRSTLLVLSVVIAAVAAVLVWCLGGSASAPPPPVDGPTMQAPQPVEAPMATGNEPESQPTEANAHRATVAPVDASVMDDPEIRAAMTGFKGRVVDHQQTPKPACGVRIYRGAIDSVLKPGLDLFAQLSTMTPEYIAGEAKTQDDGTFLIEGIWPRGMCLLYAGIGTDAPTYQILAHTPSPGEIVDLGDIVLNEAAIAVGTVVDENGDPVADALVRAVDLPGQVLEFVPVERFDPLGCLLIREKSSPVQVVEFPAWVASAYEHLPIPSTRTAADGTFRLVGITPGNNFVAATKQNLLPAVDKSTRFEKGQTKDLGILKMMEGEEVSIRVVDAAGKAIEGAEVVAGTSSLAAPIDFASRLGTTDKDGRVTKLGFGRGKATAAARRSPRDPWVLAESQPILRDVVVTLPTAATVHLRVTFQGNLVKEPMLRVFAGAEIEQTRIMSLMGFQGGLDLTGRVSVLEDGRLAIADLPLGNYVVAAKTDGSATESVAVKVLAGITQAQLELKPGKQLAVRLLGPGDLPIRNAVVYVVEEGDHERGEMPICAGRTGADGRLAVTELHSDEFRVTAEHPRWGFTHSRAKLVDGEVLLRMYEPGWIDGLLSDHGKPPPAAKYTILATERTDWQNRKEAAEGVPALATPGLDGKFAFRALQPGKYRVNVIAAIDALRSPGGVMQMGQNMFMDNLPSMEVEVVSGQPVEAKLDLVGEKYEGPIGAVLGVVQIDGAAAEGTTMQAWTEAGRRLAKVDAGGRFEMRDVPVGNVHLMLLPPAGGEGGMFRQDAIWYSNFQLAQGETKDLLIVVRTTALRGIVFKPDGSPATGIQISAQGRPLEVQEGQASSHMWRNTQTDQEGRFAFEKLAEGIYKLEMQRWGGEEVQGFRGELAEIRVESGRPRDDIVLQLRAAIKVSGRIDLSALQKKPEWSWITCRRADPAAPTDRSKATPQDSGLGIDAEGNFDSTDFEEGTYFATLMFQDGEEWTQWEIQDPFVVPATGVSGLFLRPQPPAPKPPEAVQQGNGR